jgi:hypothetical protein
MLIEGKNLHMVLTECWPGKSLAPTPEEGFGFSWTFCLRGEDICGWSEAYAAGETEA